MANCSFIDLNRKLSEASLEKMLRMVSDRWFDLRLAVKRTDWEDDGPVWLVYLPNSAPEENSGRVGKAPGEDFGFTVALQAGRRIVFRHHGLNHWESWARGCAAELISEWVDAPLEYDATGESFKPGTKRWRRRRTYLGHAARNMRKPLSKEDAEFVGRVFGSHAPKGWD